MKPAEARAIIPVIRSRLRASLEALDSFEASVGEEADQEALGSLVQSIAIAGLGAKQLSFAVLAPEDVPHVRANNLFLNFEV